MTNEASELPVVPAKWSAPNSFRALTTTRTGGFSHAPFNSLNVGHHVDDDPEAVTRNRQLLVESLALPSDPVWLEQVHGSRVAEVAKDAVGSLPTADAAVTRERECVLAIMTADCLPVVLASPDYGVIAAIHCGWRGLASDLVQNTLATMDCPPSSIHAWLGPAIGPDRFEVGDDVWDAFVSTDWQMARCFNATSEQKFMADIYALARRSLTTLGVTHITGGDHCTYSEHDTFFSYRREATTGRMVTLAWMER